MAEEKTDAKPAEIIQGKPAEAKSPEPVGTVGQSTPPAGTKTAPQGNPLMDMLPMLIGMMIIFYLLMIRPENKRRKQQQDMLGAMKKNDKVVLAASGISGIVRDIDGDEITVLIDAKKDVCVKVRKEFIGAVAATEDKEKK